MIFRLLTLFLILSKTQAFAFENTDSKSVYKISPLLDGGIILAGTLTTIVAYASPSWINRRCPCDPNEVNSFDRGAIGNNSSFARGYSDLLTGAAVVAPLIIDYFDVGWGPTLLEDAVVFAQVLAVNSALVTVVKYAVQRPVPLAYSGQYATIDEGYRSFYSGHTSTAFSALMATAMTYSLRHRPGAWPWVAAAALGTTVAVARVAGGNHFQSDVIIGGLVGTGVGLVVPWLHTQSTSTESVMLAPHGFEGVQLVYTRRL